MRSITVFFVSLVCALSLVKSAAFGDERSEALDREATNLYQQVFSPFCPGRSLNDCPSSKAAELKDDMRAQLEAGKSGEEILKGVFEKFGDQYRAVPKFAGVGVLVWLVPAGFVAVGLAIAVALSFRRRSPAAQSASLPEQRISAEEELRIQEELSKIE
jgi:cytochrome c-type biogenesis protein CcmH